MISSTGLRSSLRTALGIGLLGVTTTTAGAELGSLSAVAPLKQTITYVGKTSTTDFSAPGMGQHLQYFPAFDRSSPATGLRTDCETCLESTPDFANFEHHVPADFSGRTFSPDAPGDPTNGIPEGVKTAGGFADWDAFVLPDGTTGRSGVAYDAHTCGTSNNTVNQIRINTSGLRDFCLNLVTDNTNGRFDPDVLIEARSDDAEVRLQDHPDLVFDGRTDVYTFRYMGMEEGDEIKIRLRSEDGSSCEGGGLGGILVSHIDTCTPPPGTCTPSCGDRLCGDDGCGGSCGICPRVDKRSERTGVVSVRVHEDGTVRTSEDRDVQSVVEVGDSLVSFLDETETTLGAEFDHHLTVSANRDDLNVRNFVFTLTPKVTLETRARADGTHEFAITAGGFYMKAKFVHEDLSGPEAVARVTADYVRVTGIFDPGTGTFTSSTGEVGPIHVDIDSNTAADVLEDVLGILDTLSSLDLPRLDDEFLKQELSTKIREALESELGEATEELDGLLLPVAGLLPSELEIAGVDHAQRIRRALLDPPVGQVVTVSLDGTAAAVTSGNDAIVVEEGPTLTANVWDEFEVTAVVQRTTFPPIEGGIDFAGFDGEGRYTVSGWTCGTGLRASLDVGVFADGHAVKVDRADGAGGEDLGETCEQRDGFDRHRFDLVMAPEEVGSVNVWDNRIDVIAGLRGFEKTVRSVPRTRVESWLPDALEPVGSTANPDAPSRHFVADFDGDGRQDLMWEWYGWWVALSEGDGFRAPTRWLPASHPASGWTFNQGAPGRQLVGDFDGDGRDDYLWEWYGWWVARSHGSGFDAPTRWLHNDVDPVGRTFDPDGRTRTYVADFDADGRDDMMWRNDGWWVALSEGDGFAAPTRWLPGSHAASGATYNENVSERQVVGDFDGDGRDDLMWEWYGWWVAFSNGSGFDPPTLWLPNQVEGVGWTFNLDDPSRQFVADFDGDGRDDLMWEYYGWWVALSDGDGFRAPTRWLPNQIPSIGWTFDGENRGRQTVADFDADGRADYMWKGDGWWVALSSGSGFHAPVLWLSEEQRRRGRSVGEEAPWRWFVADFTGNGFPDHLWRNDGWNVASTLLPRTCGPESSVDADCDGVPDGLDNCPVKPNPDQSNVDADRVGDACDTACANGVDDDGDGGVDFASDGQCESWDDTSEDSVCADGIDNDGDGAIDTADVDCGNGVDSELPACMDEADNDGDGLIDHPEDRACPSPTWFTEREIYCGLGYEAAFLVPVLLLLRRGARRRSARRRAGVTGPAGPCSGRGADGSETRSPRSS